MRIPYPERISLWHAVSFATVLSVIQLWEGTSSAFSLCSFLFIVIATLAFNIAGGLTRPSGAYVLFYALLAVIVGLCWKAILGEPADSHLATPLLTIQVFLGGIIAMLGAVFISRRLATKRALLGHLVTDVNMQNATVGCMVVGLIFTLIYMLVPVTPGSILSALAPLNRFLPMAMILGVTYQMRKSGGTSAVNIPVLVAGAVMFVSGLLSYSKEGMFTPLVCWALTAASLRYKLGIYQVISAGVVLFFMFHVLVPFSQYGRNIRGETFSENLRVAYNLLWTLDESRAESDEDAIEAYQDSVQRYFDTPQGFFDRLQMISVDDGLINVTERDGAFGYTPVFAGFANLVPRVLWPDKPAINFGNLYAHEIGGLPEDDFTTGISFSPSGEGFRLGRWVGIFVVAPILWIMLFTLFDSLCGSVRDSPWGLLVIAMFSHAAPEGMLSGIISMFGFLTLSIVLAALSAAYVMPVIGTLFKGPEKSIIRRGRAIASMPRQASAIRRWQSTER